MELLVQRRPSVKGATIGEMSIDGTKECMTLEDVVREIPGKPVSEWKVPGETAIPVGRYRLVVTRSNHFQKVLPELLNVPGYAGIRIHAGNKPEDTEGCLLVGEEAQENTITRSREAMVELMAAICMAIDGGEQVWIEIRNP